MANFFDDLETYIENVILGVMLLVFGLAASAICVWVLFTGPETKEEVASKFKNVWSAIFSLFKWPKPRPRRRKL
jgi:hypothetical protein